MSSGVNVLKTELVWIGNRCYRKIPTRQTVKNPDVEDLYPDDNRRTFSEKNDIPIKHSNTGIFYISMLVPESLRGLIYSTSKAIRNNLRAEKIDIVIPKPVDSSDSIEITIKSPSEYGVCQAYERFTVCIDSFRQRANFTHFVSIPMNFDHIQKSFVLFKESVLQTCKGARGLEESIFQDPAKLHLTIVPILLLDSQEREKAVATLQKFKEEIKDILYGEPINVTIKGIEYMNDDPQEVDVLYAKVQSDQDTCLQRLADMMMQRFDDIKIATKHERSVKLHITLINTVFRKRDPAEDDGGRKKRETFDARPILKEYENWMFGDCQINKIHISVRYTTSENGYYLSLCEIPLTGK